MPKIDFQGLLFVADSTEKQPDSLFTMGNWIIRQECGTAGCMIGSFCLQNANDALQFSPSGLPKIQVRQKDNVQICNLFEIDAIAYRFNITRYEARWLFSGIYATFADDWTSAYKLDKSAALRRLRKFIYYKLHKNELIEEKGRNGYIVDHGKYLGDINIAAKVNTAPNSISNYVN